MSYADNPYNASVCLFGVGKLLDLRYSFASTSWVAGIIHVPVCLVLTHFSQLYPVISVCTLT